MGAMPSYGDTNAKCITVLHGNTNIKQAEKLDINVSKQKGSSDAVCNLLPGICLYWGRVQLQALQLQYSIIALLVYITALLRSAQQGLSRPK